MKNLLAVVLLGGALALQGCSHSKKKYGAKKKHHHKHKDKKSMARADKKDAYRKKGCSSYNKKKDGVKKEHHHKHKDKKSMARADKKHGYGKNCSIKKDMTKMKDHTEDMKKMNGKVKKEKTRARGFFN